MPAAATACQRSARGGDRRRHHSSSATRLGARDPQCNADCTLASCGDGILNGSAGEQCDDGNNRRRRLLRQLQDRGLRQRRARHLHRRRRRAVRRWRITPGDGCSATCQLENCGNNVINPGEQCDRSSNPTGHPCGAPSDGVSACQAKFCGNGIVDPGLTPGEQCDDGNTNNNDGCSSTCQSEKCGDGVVNGVEECDKALSAALNPLHPGDPCSSKCLAEPAGTAVNPADGAFSPARTVTTATPPPRTASTASRVARSATTRAT